MGGAVAIFAIAVAFVVSLYIGDRLNRSRIRHYIEVLDGEVLDIDKAIPDSSAFGKNGLGLYRVRYKDNDGAVHSSQCKTSIFFGVYFTKDFIVKRPPTTPPTLAPESENPLSDQTEANRKLREENQALREELEKMRRHSSSED